MRFQLASPSMRAPRIRRPSGWKFFTVDSGRVRIRRMALAGMMRFEGHRSACVGLAKVGRGFGGMRSRGSPVSACLFIRLNQNFSRNFSGTVSSSGAACVSVQECLMCRLCRYEPVAAVVGEARCLGHRNCRAFGAIQFVGLNRSEKRKRSLCGPSRNFSRFPFLLGGPVRFDRVPGSGVEVPAQ